VTTFWNLSELNELWLKSMQSRLAQGAYDTHPQYSPELLGSIERGYRFFFNNEWVCQYNRQIDQTTKLAFPAPLHIGLPMYLIVCSHSKVSNNTQLFRFIMFSLCKAVIFFKVLKWDYIYILQ
jgi:hypothetical protein